jgi:hypothetical protein
MLTRDPSREIETCTLLALLVSDGLIGGAARAYACVEALEMEGINVIQI